MSAYVIVEVDVTDPDRYEQYKQAAAPAVAAAGGRYMARGGAVEVFEGDPPAGRSVVLEFPSMHAARDWYHGDVYTAARTLRAGAATARIYVVDGVD
jgi:uncharacterized protein (DUF1330 family)